MSPVLPRDVQGCIHSPVYRSVDIYGARLVCVALPTTAPDWAWPRGGGKHRGKNPAHAGHAGVCETPKERQGAQGPGGHGVVARHRTWPSRGVLGLSRGSGIRWQGRQRPVWLQVRYEGVGRSWKVTKGQRSPKEPSRFQLTSPGAGGAIS